MENEKVDQKQDAAKFLSDNPAVAEKLAGLVKDEILKTLGGDMATVLANAKSKAKLPDETRQAAAGSVEMANGKTRIAMTREQCGEWFRCAILDMSGRGFEVKQDLDENHLITQALSGSLGSAGGYTVPDDFRAEVYRRNEEPEVIWPLITKRPTNRDQVTSVEVTSYVTPSKGASAKSVSATTADEIAETVPAFGEVTWNLRPMDAYVPIKLNLLDDSAINIMDTVTSLVAEGFRGFHETLPLTGQGVASKEPVGLLNAEMGLTAVTVTNVTSLSNIIGFVGNIPARYRAMSKLVMGTTLYFKTVVTLAENVRAAQFLLDALPKMLESANMPAGKILGGDFSRYVVYYNPLLKMVSETAAKRWTLDLAFQERWDGQCPITDAFRIGKVTTY